MRVSDAYQLPLVWQRDGTTVKSVRFQAAQSGFTLVELMVTSVLSGFLILGAFGLYLSHRQNYNFHESQQANLENGRFVSLLLSNAIGKASYRRQDFGQNQSFIFSALDGKFSNADLTPCNKFGNAEKDGGIFALDANDNRIDWSSAPDKLPRQICIRYQPRVSTDRDCLGNEMETKSDLVAQETGGDAETGSYGLPKDKKTLEVVVERYWFDTDAQSPGFKCAAGHLLVDTAQIGADTKTLDPNGVSVLQQYAGQQLVGGSTSGVADLRFELIPGSEAGSSQTTKPALVRTFALLRSNGGGKNDRVREYGTIDGTADPLVPWENTLGGADKADDDRLSTIKGDDKIGDGSLPGGRYLYRVVQNDISPRNP